jgi:tetratricopeptide (TPR) repeat protein
MTDKHVSSWAVSSPRRWRFYLWRGARSLESGDLRGAQRHFAAAYREAPDEPLVCLAWGRELQRAGDPAAAEKLLRRAWEADPDLDSAGLHLARLLGLHLERPDDAEAILDRLCARRGESAAALLLAAELRLRQPAEHEAAKELLERALSLGADEHDVRLGLSRAFNAEGVSLSQAGEHHRALFALKRAADLDPGWSGPYVNLGAILERLGQLAQAQREYRRALRIEPRNPVALFNLADSLRRQGRRREAARLFRRLLEVAPAYPGGALGLRRLLEDSPQGGGDRLGPE